MISISNNTVNYHIIIETLELALYIHIMQVLVVLKVLF